MPYSYIDGEQIRDDSVREVDIDFGVDSGQVKAESLPTDITNFNNVLSSADTTTQRALDTLDDVLLKGNISKKNVICVAKNGNDTTGNGTEHNPYLTIHKALSVITDSSETNTYNVSVGPGVYSEPLLTVPVYTSVTGETINATKVEPDSATHNVFNLSNLSELTFMSIGNAGTGYAAINVLDVGDFAQVHKISIYDSDIGIQVTSNTQQSWFYGEYIDINGSMTTAVKVLAQNYHFSFVNLENFYVFPADEYKTLLECSGIASEMSILSGTIAGTGKQTGIKINNGAILVLQAFAIYNADTAIHVENVGARSIITLNGMIQKSTTFDIVIDHVGTIGSFTGTADYTKVSIAAGAEVGMSYSDFGSIGQAVLKDIYQGYSHGKMINFSMLGRETATMGKTFGGILSNPSGRLIDVTRGAGFIIDPIELYIKEVAWESVQIEVPANSETYVYVNNNSVVSMSSSATAPEQTISLGRCVATASALEFFINSPMLLSHYSNENEEMLRSTLGSIFGSGCLISENGSTARALNATGGKYYYGINSYLPSEKTAFTFKYFWRNGSGGWNSSDATVVDNLHYDDGTGTLATLSTVILIDYYAKHSLYTVGDSADQKYFLVCSQAEYSGLTAAENGNIPTPPYFIKEEVVLLASIIVKKNATHIAEIIDQRPRIGFKPSALSSVADHGDLTGLSDDDHSQYLLISGTRSMTGSLNMGTNNITSVGTVDGVDVSSHESRHLPNGSDPLTTAAPTASLTASTTNTVGVQNSLSRSDHSHSITTGAASTQTPDQTNAEGVSSNVARADHVHNIATATPTDVGSSNAQGSATSFNKSDHVHKGIHSVKAESTGTQRFGDVTLAAGQNVDIVDGGNGIFTISTQDNLFLSEQCGFEDFMFDAYAGAGSNDNQYAFSAAANNGSSNIDGSVSVVGNDYEGIHILDSLTSATARPLVAAFNNINRIKLGAQEESWEIRVRIETLVSAAQMFTCRFGLMDITTIGTPTNGILFSYLPVIAESQIVTTTPSVLTAGVKHYIQTINGTAYDFTSDATPTATEVVTGLKALINADGPLPVTATGTTTLILTADVPGTAFTYSVNSNMTQALTHANVVFNGNWHAKTVQASSIQDLDTLVPVVANQWYKLKSIINSTATNVDFYINDVYIGNSQTLIPLVAMKYLFKLEKTVGTVSRTCSIDYIGWRRRR